MIFKSFLFTLIVAVTLVNALPVTKYTDGKSADVLTYSNKPANDGGYSFEYSTSDGNYRKEDAVFRQPADTDHEGYLSIDGVYSFIGSDGNKYTVVYHADENGYHPVSSNVEMAGTF